MADFFSGRGSDDAGLAVFLNAGDPPMRVLTDVVLMLDERGVDCLELAVPFPKSATDGPVVRRSADRALGEGVDLRRVLDFVAHIRPRLRHLRIALLADWSHSIKGGPLRPVLTEIAAAGVDGLLLHALPPRLRPGYHEASREIGVPIVTTCYHRVSAPSVVADAAANASAYLYLVASYGRSGAAPTGGYGDIADAIAGIRRNTTAPIAVGFGVRSRADVAAIAAAGADGVIVGSTVVSTVEDSLAAGRDVVTDLAELVDTLHGNQKFPTSATSRRR